MDLSLLTTPQKHAEEQTRHHYECAKEDWSGKNFAIDIQVTLLR